MEFAVNGIIYYLDLIGSESQGSTIEIHTYFDLFFLIWSDKHYWQK